MTDSSARPRLAALPQSAPTADGEPVRQQLDRFEVQAHARGWMPPDAVEMLVLTCELAGIGEVLHTLRAELPDAVWAQVAAVVEPVYGLPLPGPPPADHPTLW